MKWEGKIDSVYLIRRGIISYKMWMQGRMSISVKNVHLFIEYFENVDELLKLDWNELQTKASELLFWCVFGFPRCVIVVFILSHKKSQIFFKSIAKASKTNNFNKNNLKIGPSSYLVPERARTQTKKKYKRCNEI